MFCDLCGPQNPIFDNERRFHIFNNQLFEWTGVLRSKTSDEFRIEMTPTVRPDDKQVLSFKPNGAAFSQCKEEAGSKITFIGMIRSKSFQYHLCILPRVKETLDKVNRTLTFNTYYTAFVHEKPKRDFIFDRMYRGRRILLLGSFISTENDDKAFPQDITRDVNVPYRFWVYPHAMDGFTQYPDVRIIIQKDSADESQVKKHLLPAVFEIVAEFISYGIRAEDPVWLSLKKITTIIPTLSSTQPKQNQGGGSSQTQLSKSLISISTVNKLLVSTQIKPDDKKQFVVKPVQPKTKKSQPAPKPKRSVVQDLSQMTKQQRTTFLQEEAKKEGLICPITKVLLVDPVRGRLNTVQKPNDPTEHPIATVSRACCEDPQAVTDHNAVERLEEFKTNYAAYLDDMFPKIEMDDDLFD
ncbi:hypothetical protein BLNAU_13917 [Blattamonas nauphoetae]|uniref:Uncharacterized protein n=1 Tax=Blattamonas nauphoetae TaxID=2049346 RepID=A0ABQ9XIA1_9EUKA|nr:hypothetical protein BLNAU_13917 [Blattamonas nauphoetae]